MLEIRTTESCFDRLEREANDEMHLLEEVGAKQFSTEHLLELRGQVRTRLAIFERWQRLSMLFGIGAAGCIVLCAIFLILSHPWLLMASGILMTLNIAGFFYIVLTLKRKYESKGELEHSRRLIEDELRSRQSSGKLFWGK